MRQLTKKQFLIVSIAGTIIVAGLGMIIGLYAGNLSKLSLENEVRINFGITITFIFILEISILQLERKVKKLHNLNKLPRPPTT